MNLSIKAPAKINWFLSIIGKRADGYHDIVSPMQCVSLFDDLWLEASDKIELVTDLAIPVEDNIVYKSAVLLKERIGYSGGARITLKKNIPSAAGLGGGSSDAAFTLTGLNRLWHSGLDRESLMLLGAEIGSDVPFFTGGPFSLVEGRGERVSPLESKGAATLLLVNPGISVSSAWAYSNFDPKMLTKKSVDIKLFCQTLDRKDLVSLQHMVFNDLENAVMTKYHEVAEIREMLLENGAVIASMSGSGPTVFGVFRSAQEAMKASENMGKYWCRVVSTLGVNEMREMWL
jgi:4-diphosphocytidyl-2-C-methyl-D-erythritol kinase